MKDPFDHPAIAARLAPFLGPATLEEPQLAQVSAYLDLLLRWNARINLTAVRRPEQILTRHFGESFFLARHVLGPLAGRVPLSVIDVGSGAGFPGLPLKIYRPEIRLTLIESNHKKAAFLKEVVRSITLMDVNVFTARAADFPATAGVVTLRAVERYQLALAAAARLVSPAGRLALLIGAAQAETTPSLLAGFACARPLPVPQSSARVLLLATNQAG